MSAVLVMLASIAVVVTAYFTYGSFVARRLGLDDSLRTPAHTLRDGVDYVPSGRPVVLGHHFASIAGAGPIVGPIIAVSFGWLPTLAWILIGVVFIGAVHDLSALTASIRHEGRTISDIVEDYVGLPAKRLFVLFAFAALILVVGVFGDIVARTFVAQPEVATTSVLFIALAVGYGVATQRFGVPALAATVVGVLGLAGCVYAGHVWPMAGVSYGRWVAVILAYVAVAAVTPVWILLQPRDYLNSYLLYGMLGAGVAGLVVAQPTLQLDAFTGFRHETYGFIFPILFVTVACGAISGFHSLVASGTTSKQLDREGDAKFIGYGGMLLEGVLAVLALIAAGVLSTTEHAAALASAGPIAIFSRGVGGFMATLGVSEASAVSFVALAVSAFALTSLDTCTRLARLLFSEFFSTAQTRRALRAGLPERGSAAWLNNRFVGTGIVVALGGVLTYSGEFSAAWPVFGAANQLLAALALLTVAVWLSNRGVAVGFVLAPMSFMFAVTTVALGQLFAKNAQQGNQVLTVLSGLLLALSVVLLVQAGQSVLRRRGAQPARTP